MLWTVLIIVGALLVLLVVALLVMAHLGKKLPPQHTMTCTMPLSGADAEQVYAAVVDVESWPQWAKGVNRVEMLERSGEPRFRMFMGRNRMLCRLRAARRPRSLEVHVEDERAKIFSGVWTYQFVPEPSGVRVELTEVGTIHSALPRYMARKLADPAMYLKRHLRHLAAKFGQEGRISQAPAAPERRGA